MKNLIDPFKSFCAHRSTVWGTLLAFLVTVAVLQICNHVFFYPPLDHLSKPVKWTTEANAYAIGAAYGDEVSGVIHVSTSKFKTFPAFAFNGSFKLAQYDEKLWRDWVKTDHGIKNEIIQARRNNKKVREEELKVQHKSVSGSLPEESFLTIIWSPDQQPDVDSAKSGKRRIVVLELFAPKDLNEVRYQFYVVVIEEGEASDIGIQSPRDGRLLYSSHDNFLFRPCFVSTNEQELAESFFVEGQRLTEAAGLDWEAPLTEDAERVTRFVEAVILRWTSHDGQNLHQLTALPRLFNGPNSSGFVQFLIQFVFWSAILNLILRLYWPSSEKNVHNVFRNSLIPMNFGRLTILLFGTLGTMLGMRAVSQEIGQPVLNTTSISNGLSAAYDTTALALCALLIVQVLASLIEHVKIKDKSPRNEYY